MFVFGDRVVCTAVDLVRAARCEFALLRALDAEMGTAAPIPDGAPEQRWRPLAESTRFDDARERRLADLRDRFGTAMVEIRLPAHDPDDPAAHVAALHAAHTDTVAALRAGVHVVHGATFFDGGFASSCDFLVRAGHRVRYTVYGSTGEPERDEWSSTAHPPDPVGGALELAACADGLDSSGALTAPLARLFTGERGADFALVDLLPVYQARRRRLSRIMEEKLGELLPVQWGDTRYSACGRCPACRSALSAARDVLLVAGMGPTVRARLRESGVHTIDRLAVTASTVPGVSPRTFGTLRRQAEIQLRREQSGRPVHLLIDELALGALPVPSPGDLALTLATAGQSCLLEVAGPETMRLSLRDTGIEGLRRVIAEAVEFLAQHRAAHPDMHVYHYGAGMRTALLRGAGGVEETLDELLRAGVLVDLYPIVRNALLVGERSYRLSRIRRLLSEADAHSAERDCLIVLRLRDWLLTCAAGEQRGDPPVPHLVVVEVPRAGSWCVVPDRGAQPTGPEYRPSSLEAALTEYAAAQAEPRHPAALMAAALGYHRRERKPLWYAHTDRLSHPFDEWPDSPGVLIAEWGTVDTKWHHSPQRQTMRRYLTLTGRIGGGSGAGSNVVLTPGTSVYTFYDRPVPAGMVTAVGRRATATATVLGCSVDAEFDDTVRLEELLPDGCEPFDDLPTALAPGLPAWDESTEAALEFTAQQLLMTLPEVPHGALFDILLRRKPRLRRALSLPAVHGDHAAAITVAVADLDRSYLAVQGPSGTGRTSTAARVIERLVTKHRWRVGVVARSHTTVEHLLDAVVLVGVLPELVAKKEVEAVAPEWAVIDAARYPRFLDNAVNGCVIGGLPTDFADEELIGREALDLLVIADAGGFSLADTAAVAVSARNLLVLGDAAPATALGTHPEPVDTPVLNWLIQDQPTLPADRGYFLDRTWRMHPRVCEPISRLWYDNRLRANETVTLARHLDGVPPGISTVLVDHHGSATESDAEAREVVRRVRALLGAAWTIGAVTRRLHPHDIFVIAPYSAQVGRIRTMLARARIEDVLVGTVDRFRGREAAVVLLSMTTSSPADAPYGMPYLLSRTLIQAALCRAMWKAVIIRSPLLTEYLPATTDELPDLAGFLTLS